MSAALFDQIVHAPRQTCTITRAIQTAVLIETLKDLGADVRWPNDQKQMEAES